MRGPILRLARLIEDLTGFVIRERNFTALGTFADRRAEITGIGGLDQYVDFLDRHPESEEWRMLLSKITIKESYLFRGQVQFDALVEILIPELVEVATNRRIQIWSAGCAHGEEAATLAIVLNEHPLLEGWDWSILGSDVDRNALSEARTGVYSKRAVERVPAEYLERYFVTRGNCFALRSDLLRRITYRHVNLVEAELDFEPGTFDFIFLRNVLIYFRPALQRQVLRSSSRALSDRGSVFLGPSESLLHLGSELEARDLGSCFTYRHGRRETPTSRVLKNRAITGRGRTPAPISGPDPIRERDGEAGRDDRIEEVVSALEGRVGAGEVIELIDTLRRDYPENALVHALEGVARELTGDLEAAIEAYRGALYLAPDFSEARFFLASALVAAGREGRAVREFRAVLAGLSSQPVGTTSLLMRIGLPDRAALVEKCHEILERNRGTHHST